MNENEIMNNENEQVEVNEQNTGLTTGEKLTVGAVAAAAIVGCVTVGKFAYEKGKKGLGWLKTKIKKEKKEEVPVEEPKTEVPQEKTEG